MKEDVYARLAAIFWEDGLSEGTVLHHAAYRARKNYESLSRAMMKAIRAGWGKTDDEKLALITAGLKRVLKPK